MAISFVKASKAQSKLRLGLVGPSGSGKTYTALRIAKGLGGKIAVIDTERGSASKYAGEICDFDVVELSSYAPTIYVEAIRAAERAGYDVLIIDSLSHAWMGKDGALEMVDRAARRSDSKNSFAAWREVTPHHNALVEAILQSRCHVIATMRAKTEYVLEENERGKKLPRKVGMAAVQREGLEYELDIVANLDHEHTFVVDKTRCAALDQYVTRNAGEEVAERLKEWLGQGAPRAQPAATSPTATSTPATHSSSNEPRHTVPASPPPPAEPPPAPPAPPAESSEPPAGVREVIAQYARDVAHLSTADQLVTWAASMRAIPARKRGDKAEAWAAWERQCTALDLKPSVLARRAEKLATDERAA